MTERPRGERDPIGLWFEMSRAFLGTEPGAAPGSDQDGEALGEPLRQHCEALFATWRRFAETYAETAGGGEAGPSGATGATGTMGGPFDPFAWMDGASGGGLGDLWNWFGAGGAGWQAEREALLGSREWAAYSLALSRYQAVMAAAWLRAFQRFSQALAAEQAGAQQGDVEPSEPPSWETIRARWQEAADLELARAMRGQAFLDAQRELIRARLDCAALIRARLERLADLLGMPTRAELDELGERVHALGREVRELKAATGGGG